MHILEKKKKKFISNQLENFIINKLEFKKRR